MNLLLFGPPGAGKGTQSAKLIDKFSMMQISTGDLFRKAIKTQSKLGIEARTYIDKGMLVPDEIVTGMVQEDLQIFFSNALGLGLILDGYPRTIVQAQSLEIFLKKFKKKIDKAIFINLPHQVIIDRLSGRRICKACGTVFHVRTGTKVFGKCDKCNDDLVQRSDDKEDVIKSRLDIYYKSANTLSEFYKELGLYCEIDGLGSPVEVFNRLCTAIEK